MESLIPKVEDYLSLLNSKLFKNIEDYSNCFLIKHDSILNEYKKKWVTDPLHQWSRQWEYPYVFKSIQNTFSNINGNYQILDAGCGVTFFPFYLSQQFPNSSITGLDHDQGHGNLINRISKSEKKKIEFVAAPMSKTGFTDSYFDIIYCISVLEHTDNYKDIIDEYFRILRPGGKLIVTFDISIDGTSEVAPDKAQLLLENLKEKFKFDKNDEKEIPELLKNDNNVTTKYAFKLDPNLIWCKEPSLNKQLTTGLKSLIKNRKWISFPPLLTFFCITMTKLKT